MGIIQSIICTTTFCIERVLTWVCCAFVLMFLMLCLVLLMVYGISAGYHYAQKELAFFAMYSRSTTTEIWRRAGTDTMELDRPSVVRLLAVNRSQVESAPHRLLRIYQSRRPGELLNVVTPETRTIMIDSERPVLINRQPTHSSHERELARRIIGRFRRSKNNSMTISTPVPFLKQQYRNSTEALRKHHQHELYYKRKDHFKTSNSSFIQPLPTNVNDTIFNVTVNTRSP